jgi:tripartite-type tricarboxylate transporter receptor subunit TctC
MLGRRDLIALSAAQVVTTSLLLGAGRAQTPNGTYPSKPVRVIVPVAAGGPTDIVARALADKLSAMWHQQVIIENKSGAGNNLGCE